MYHGWEAPSTTFFYNMTTDDDLWRNLYSLTLPWRNYRVSHGTRNQAGRVAIQLQATDKVNLWHWELWDDDTKFIILPTILLLQRLEDSVLYSGQIEENKSAGLCSAKRRFLLRQQQKAVISNKSLS